MNLTKSIIQSAFFSFLIIFQSALVFAQDAEISDEELTKYIAVNAQIDTLKSAMSANINELIKGNELMDKGRVYNALKKAKGDSVAVAALELSPEQIAAYEQILVEISNQKASFKENYTAVIKEDIGAGMYNKIKKALKSDATLNERYDALVTDYSASAGSTDEGSDGEG